MDSDSSLTILHDHYKETFARIRELEKTRDRHFLIVIALYGFLALQIAYPAEFSGSVDTITLLGTQLKLGSLPLAALLSATWVFTFAIGLRYCQGSLAIDRQYPYLHELERTISPLVGGGNLYQREGEVYLNKYPLMLNGAWFAYVVLFPLLLLTATVTFVVAEWLRLDRPWPHSLFDSGIGLILICFFYLYRFEPYVRERIHRSSFHGKRG